MDYVQVAGEFGIAIDVSKLDSQFMGLIPTGTCMHMYKNNYYINMFRNNIVTSAL